jgi:hypothetical protein
MAYSPSEPIEDVISRVYAKPTSRQGERSGRLWWVCPFHDDRNPSLCVVPGKPNSHGCNPFDCAPVDLMRLPEVGWESCSESARPRRGQVPDCVALGSTSRSLPNHP